MNIQYINTFKEIQIIEVLEKKKLNCSVSRLQTFRIIKETGIQVFSSNYGGFLRRLSI